MQADLDLSTYQPATDALHERVILVTGAGDGLGRALSLSLAALGATIILVGKTTRKLEQVYDLIEAQGGPQAAIFPMDLAKVSEPDFIGLANAVQENFTALHGLVLNAAVLGQHSPVVHTDLAQWQRALQVNLTSQFLFSKHFAGLLNAAGRSSLLFVSDRLAEHGKAYWSSYASLKAAADHLMQTTADEWEANTQIHVNSIAPPAMQTALRRQAFPAEDPSSLPGPDQACKPFHYLLDPGNAWPRGERFSWEPATEKLTKF